MQKTHQYSSLKILLQLVPYVATMKLRLLVSLIATLATISFSLIIPFILKTIVTTLSHAQQTSPLLLSFLLIGYGFSWTANQLISQLRILFACQILERGKRSITLHTFDHLLALSPRFHADRQTGALTSYLDKAQHGFETIFWSIFIFLLPTTLELMITIIIFSTLFGPLYGLILAFIMVGYLLFSLKTITKTNQARELFNEKSAQATAKIVDSLLNYETVKYFNNQMYEHTQADTLLKQQEEASIKLFNLDMNIQIGQLLIIGIGLSSIIWLAGNAVYQGTISLGNFVLINGYLLQFIMPLNYLSNTIYQARKGLQDVKTIIELLHLEPEIKYKNSSPPCTPNKPTLSFKNVSFKYQSNDRTILKNISFSVPSGTTTAIVGPSGSGKSTLAKLIFRFYDITKGTILLNNHDIKAFGQEALHKQIGIVPQDIPLFNHTLYYNIAYASPHASEQQVLEAAQQACLESFINSLPKGYMTLVGERGLKLSGGEKQRIALARLILRQPSLYIFDEATSSLDSRTEQKIQQNLTLLAHEKTTLIIAHRLSTIIHADQIIVLDQGQIVECDTHTRLLQQHGLYAQLWNKQQQSFTSSHNIKETP